MTDDLAVPEALNGGYVTRQRHQLNDLGYSDALIGRMVRDGLLQRIRHGTYVLRSSYLSLDSVGRHRVKVNAVLDKLGPKVAASHQSAAAQHGCDLWGVDLSHVHVTRLDGRTGRREAGVIYHEGAVVGDRDIAEIDSRLVIEPVRAVYETASQASIESGMVVASSALRQLAISLEEMQERGADFDHWPGTRSARLAVRLSDPRLESVGEVRSFHLMWRFRLHRPEFQFVVTDDRGRPLAHTDYYWDAFRHTGEFDGLIKYGRLNPYSNDPGQAIVDEKRREDLVRDQLLGMSRWVWGALEPTVAERTATWLHQGLERSRRLYTRNATTISLA